jgi:exopolysaccharide biosynthesis polyprenyl glycosylphosphotransferase
LSGLDQSIELSDVVAAPPALPRGWVLRRALLLADVAGLLFTVALTEVIYGHLTNSHPGVGVEFGLFVLTLPVWIVLAKAYGLYDRDECWSEQRTVDDLTGIFHLVTVGTWIVFAGTYLADIATPNLKRVTVFWALSVVDVVAARAVARSIARRHDSFVQNTLIVGADSVGRKLAKKLEQNTDFGLRPIGFVDADPGRRVPGADHRVVCSLDDLPRAVRELGVARVIVCFPPAGPKRLLAVIRELNQMNVQVDIVPRFYDLLTPGIEGHMVGGVAIWSLKPARLSRSTLLVKRAMDVVLAVLGLLVLTPLLVVIAVAIKADSRGPVFFRQVRIRDSGRTFRMWKFRTMVIDAEDRKRELAHMNVHARDGGSAVMFKVENDPRITRVGSFLRRFSLDELPQLLNVISGEMSLVGPRPLIPEEDEHVTNWRRRRLDLKPGVTGLWQVNGRSRLPFDEMVALDYRYVSNWSLAGDLAILLRTIPIVLRGSATAQ